MTNKPRTPDLTITQHCYFECAKEEGEKALFMRVKAAIEDDVALEPAEASRVRETVNNRIKAYRSALDAAIFG